MKERQRPYLKCAQQGCLARAVVLCEEQHRKRLVRVGYCARHARGRMEWGEQDERKATEA